jgi:hypothetical protein
MGLPIREMGNDIEGGFIPLTLVVCFESLSTEFPLLGFGMEKNQTISIFEKMTQGVGFGTGFSGVSRI